MFSKSKISSNLIALFASAVVMILSNNILHGSCVSNYHYQTSHDVSGVLYSEKATFKADYDIYNTESNGTGDDVFHITGIKSNVAFADSYFFEKAIMEILREEFFSGRISSGDDIWFVFPACWEEISDILSPCNQTYCCKAKYTIGTSNGEPVIVSQSLSSDNVNCDPLGTNGCEYVCSALNFAPDPQTPYLLFWDKPGCYTSPWWDHWGYAEYTYNNGPVKANYHVFDCYHNQIEVAIDEIISTDGNYNLGTDEEAIYLEATRKVLKEAAMNNPGNIDTIALAMETCWELISNNNAMIPCNTDDCCSATFIVTYDSGTGSYFADLQGTISGQNNCSALDCEFICDDDHIWTDDQTALKSGVLMNAKNKDIKGLEISPNPSTGKLEVKVNRLEKGMLIVSIFDNYGSEVYSRSFKKTSEVARYDLDLDILSNGAYYLVVEINGDITLTNKFMIIK